jgi:deoxyribonuclease-4
VGLRSRRCRVELGARKDRHEHFGKGFIGLDGFRAIVASKELQHINLYAETDPEGVVEDIEILKKMRGKK